MEQLGNKNNSVEKKAFGPTVSHIEIETTGVWGMLGKQVVLSDSSGERIGYMDLWDNDDNFPDGVKVKYIGIAESYRGSGAVFELYKQALEIAKKSHKDLLLDCAASPAAYKSFKKFAKDQGLTVVENETTQWEEGLKRYKADPGTWTLKIVP